MTTSSTFLLRFLPRGCARLVGLLLLAVAASAQRPDGDYGGPGGGGVYSKVGSGAEKGPEHVELRISGGVGLTYYADGSDGFNIADSLGDIGVLLSTELYSMDSGEVFFNSGQVLYYEGGRYRATNQVGNTVYRLDLGPATSVPAIDFQPAGAVVQLNETVRLLLSAHGGAPLSYRWFRGATELPEFTGRIVEFRASAQNLGPYRCVVSNPQGSVTSSVALVKLDVPAPTVGLPATFPLTLGGNSSLGVTVTGGQGPFTYQWTKDGQLVAGATKFDIAFAPATANDAGTYRVVVADGFGNSVTSSPCAVTVPLPAAPLVFADPKGAILPVGSQTILIAKFLSQPLNVPPVVRWRKDGVDVPGGEVFLADGLFTATFPLADLRPGDSGNYDCVAINGGGTSPATKAARVIVKTATAPDVVDLAFNAGTANHIAFNNPDGDGAVEGIAVQPDDKVIVVGKFKQWNGQARTNIVRLNVDGSLDTTFAAHHFTSTVNGEIAVPGVAVAPDGKIYVTGTWGSMDGSNTTPLVRLDADGKLDPTFNPGTGAPGFLLLVRPDGTLFNNGGSLVGGAFRYLLRYPAGGALDVAFGAGFTAARTSGSGPSDWFADPDGALVLGGSFGAKDASGVGRFNLTKLNPDGSVASNFRSPLAQLDGVNHLARLPDGKFVATGDFQPPAKNVRRFNSDGSADNAFSSPVTDSAFAPLLVDADGTVFLPTGSGNEFTRLQADGAMDDTFFVHVDDDIKLTALDSKGRLIIAGFFTKVTGSFNDPAHTVARKSIARLYGRNAAAPVTPTEVKLGAVTFVPGGPLGFTLTTQTGVTYVLETKTGLGDANWTVAQTLTGDGSVKKLEAALAGITGFFRVRVQ